MHRPKLVFIILLTFFYLPPTAYHLSLYAEDAASTNFELAFMKVGSVVMAASASDSMFTYFLVGEVFSVPEEVTSAEAEVSFSYDDILPRVMSPVEYEIAEVGAKTHVGGFEIKPQIWQKDNDPYFYWLIFINPPTLIKGFSLSLDELPDEEVDTTGTSYQYGDDEIFDGQHTFYVMPWVAEETWGPPVEFDIWIDTTSPSINALNPSPGALIAAEEVEIRCQITDAMSGLDLDNLELIVNDQTVSADYDEEEKILSYTMSPSDGENVILVKAQDLAANQAVKSWSIIVDTDPPVCTMVINNDDPITNSAYVVLKFTVEDELSGVKYIYISNDGIFDTEMSSPFDFTPVITDWLLREPEISGAKTVYARFEDNAGNISGKYSDDIDLVVTVPDTRIVSAPLPLTQESDAAFYYEASRQGCLFSYSLDGADWSGWQQEDNVSFSGLELGSHFFRVKAGFDIDGDEEISLDEEDPTPAQWTWTVREETLMERLQRTLFFRRR